MKTSRSYWMRVLCVVLVVILLLEAVEARPAKKDKKRQRERIKHCGAKGHPCQPGSRKLCCTVGYTCKLKEIASNLTKAQRITKPSIGTCEPILPIRKNDREIEEHRPSPKVNSSPKTPPSPKASSNQTAPAIPKVHSNRDTHSGPSFRL